MRYKTEVFSGDIQQILVTSSQTLTNLHTYSLPPCGGGSGWGDVLYSFEELGV